MKPWLACPECGADAIEATTSFCECCREPCEPPGSPEQVAARLSGRSCERNVISWLRSEGSEGGGFCVAMWGWMEGDEAACPDCGVRVYVKVDQSDEMGYAYACSDLEDAEDDE